MGQAPQMDDTNDTAAKLGDLSLDQDADLQQRVKDFVECNLALSAEGRATTYHLVVRHGAGPHGA